MNTIIFYSFRNTAVLAVLFIIAGVMFNDKTLPFMLRSVFTNSLYLILAGVALAVLPYLDGEKKLNFGSTQSDRSTSKEDWKRQRREERIRERSDSREDD